MLHLDVSAKHRYVKIVHFHKLHFYLSFSNFMLWQCCASGQFRFRHKSNLVRVAHLEIVLNTHTTITYVTRKCPNISLKLSAFVTTNTAGSFKISRGFHAQCKNTIMNRGFSFVSHPIKNIQLWYHWCDSDMSQHLVIKYQFLSQQMWLENVLKLTTTQGNVCCVLSVVFMLHSCSLACPSDRLLMWLANITYFLSPPKHDIY